MHSLVISSLTKKGTWFLENEMSTCSKMNALFSLCKYDFKCDIN